MNERWRARSSTGSALGAAVGLAGIASIIGSMMTLREWIPHTVPALLLLIPIVAASVFGGWRIAVPLAFVAATGYALAFLPPIGSIRVGLTEDVLVLITFVVVAIAVGLLKGPSTRGTDDRLLDERRALLLRGVSHDLRNPLSTIRSISTELLDVSNDYDASTRLRLLGRVVDESDRLERIVGNLLSVSRVEAGALNPSLEPESLDSLVSRCVNRLDRAGTHTLCIEIEPGLSDVAADAVQIDQVLTNLVENALRHTPPGTSVTVAARNVGDVVEVTVSDTGHGFSERARATAFCATPNAQLHSSGLGLGVCKAIVEAHGGTIAVRADTTDGGAAISFTLRTYEHGSIDSARRG